MVQMVLCWRRHCEEVVVVETRVLGEREGGGGRHCRHTKS